MKKIFRGLLVLLLGLILTACTNSGSFPEVNDKNKIDLSAEQLREELQGVTINQAVLQLNINADIEAEGTKIKLNADAHMLDDELVASVKLEGTLDDSKLNANAKLYAVSEGLFLDGKLSFETSGSDFNVNGKYKLDSLVESTVPGGSDINDLIGLDLETILDDQTFLDLVESYEGLTFYKKDSLFQIRFIFNNELFEKHREKFETILEGIIIPLNSNLEFEMVLSINDKKLSNFGLKLKVTGEEKIDILITASIVTKMPSIPSDFKEYKEFNIFDLM